MKVPLADLRAQYYELKEEIDAAIVAVKHNERIIAQAALLERRDHLADAIVHHRDHGRVGPPIIVLDVLEIFKVILASVQLCITTLMQ